MLHIFKRDPRFARVGIFVLGIGFLLAMAGLSFGQSGRKPPKPQPPPTSSTHDDQGGPAKPDNPAPSKPKIPITVASYLPNTGSSSIYTNIVVDGCLERLKQSGAFEITRGREMNRKEASDLAKGSTDSYVLWIELRSDRGDVMMEPRYASELYVDYVLFAPGTGKTRTAGHVYQRRTGALGTPLPLPLPPTVGRGPIESQLDRAGRDTADRVIAALNLPQPH